MMNDIEKVLYTEEQLREKAREIGRRVSEDYKGEELVVVGILKGSIMFMADVLKEITIPCVMDFMAVSSYGNSSTSSGVVRILKDLDQQIEGKHVLIVEDIIDSGTTLKYLVKYFANKNTKSVEIACLLNKPERRKVELDIKYLGYQVPDYFLVGYGLDFAEKYRNLPYIGILKPEVYEGK
ncbi:hypoxanthine phosphoribosyltransferase [Hathewaya proteolytica DSM 3090]|uniref:Hypoxanthine phosphoribosyltransferase n=1 Tax=Hathewaya proteolytica DSM 3090 TaxID=1121331 RepID=A0A1M6M8S6_9CLOT|nr:hypoxanthine phosphoribosyltransferase [Hathewaya proteolytica]SHJ79927.1 hypoxanthine phosphoribosyltransferase [Hathewaya proteolytica DSM 3090]